QPRTRNLVALHALQERNEVAPAALVVLRRPEALVLQHAAAQLELFGCAVAEVRHEDHRVAQPLEELAQPRKARRMSFDCVGSRAASAHRCWILVSPAS